LEFLARYCFDEIKEDAMGEAYGTQGRKEKCVQILVGKLKGKNQLKPLGVDGTVILKSDLKNMKWENVD
jgi:hypothetical protein